MKRSLVFYIGIAGMLFCVAGSSPSQLFAQQSIEDVRTQYRSSLETYRTDERQFQLAKDQFLRVQTLASLESAVQATRVVLLARADILALYLQQVSSALAAAEGLTDSQRAAALDEVQSVINGVRAHRLASEQAITRTAVNAVVTDFTVLGESVKSVSYRSQTLLAYGKIRAAYEQVLLARQEVEAELLARNLSGLQLGEKQRALTELDRAIAQITTRMDQITAQIFPDPTQAARSSSGSKVYTQVSYTQAVTQLSQVYGELLRIVEYLQEVAQ